MKRIQREDAIRVAEALLYDPDCPKCLDMPDPDNGYEEYKEHDDTCAIAARDRILAAAEEAA